MAKWQILICLILVMPLAYGAVTVQWSPDNATWRNVTSVDEAEKEAHQAGLLEQSGLYYFRGRNDSTEWYYLQQRMDEGGENWMGALAITLFLIGINLALFILPFFFRFTDEEATNVIIKRCVWLLGLAVLAFNTTILASMADSTNLGVTDSLFVFQWLFLRGLYIAMILLFFSIFISVPKLWKERKMKKRMGDYEE